MSRIYRLIRKLLPVSRQLAWTRSRIERGYGRDIATATRNRNPDEVRELESAMRFELELQREEEDAYLTRQLRRQATRLRVPVPLLHVDDGAVSDHWYHGRQTGAWYLTLTGIRALREEIRHELKARYEHRVQLVVWLSAITGIIGAVTGLVAVLQKHG
jgi:hypothetical protein